MKDALPLFLMPASLVVQVYRSLKLIVQQIVRAALNKQFNITAMSYNICKFVNFKENFASF